MQTYIVRVFEAADEALFAGWVEEPLTGLRSPFHDAVSLLAALGQPVEPTPGGSPESATTGGDPGHVVRSDQQSADRRNRCGP